MILPPTGLTKILIPPRNGESIKPKKPALTESGKRAEIAKWAQSNDNPSPASIGFLFVASVETSMDQTNE